MCTLKLRYFDGVKTPSSSRRFRRIALVHR